MNLKSASVALAIVFSSGFTIAGEVAPAVDGFEKLEVSANNIEILYKKLPVSVITNDRTLNVAPEGRQSECDKNMRKKLNEGGFKAETSSPGQATDFTCATLYTGKGAGLYGEDKRSVLSYLGQGLGIVARIGLAVAGGKAAMDLGGAGAANVVATNVLTGGNGKTAGAEIISVERNTLFGDDEFIRVMRVCHTASQQCSLVFGVIHKDKVEVQDMLAFQKAATDVLGLVANLSRADQTASN